MNQHVIPAWMPASAGCEAAIGWRTRGGKRKPIFCGQPVTHVIAALHGEGHMPACDAHVRRLHAEQAHVQAYAVPLATFVEQLRRTPYVGACAGCQCVACTAARAATIDA